MTWNVFNLAVDYKYLDILFLFVSKKEQDPVDRSMAAYRRSHHRRCPILEWPLIRPTAKTDQTDRIRPPSTTV